MTRPADDQASLFAVRGRLVLDWDSRSGGFGGSCWATAFRVTATDTSSDPEKGLRLRVVGRR